LAEDTAGANTAAAAITAAAAFTAAAPAAACLQMSPTYSLGDQSPAAGIVLLPLLAARLAALGPGLAVLLLSNMK